jgi:transcriptional regulator with XRE-family HTH domain
MESILKNIRAIRESKNLSQEYVAELMNLTQSRYARFEKGDTRTELGILIKFCEALRLDLIDVITYPKKYIDPENGNAEKKNNVKVMLQIEVSEDKKEQLLKLVFDKNDLEILK